MRTREEYKNSLRDGRRVFYEGAQVDDVTTHPALGAAVSHACIDFDLAEEPERQELCTIELEGARIPRLFAPPRSAEDILRRSELIATLTREGATLVTLIKEIGTDALFGLMSASAEMGMAGERYGERVQAFWREAMEGDLAMAVAQTDVKGDRSKTPGEQDVPDTYVHIVGERDSGIVIRGAKAHTSAAINANELIVLPTRALKPGEEKFAVACAVPPDTRGITMIASPFASPRGSSDDYPISATRKLADCLTIFDDVFVPWDRVFLAGETECAGRVALAFVEFHRFTAISYKIPLCEALVGAAILIARQNGVEKMSHIRGKLIDLVAWTETLKGLVQASAYACEATAAGFMKPNTLLVNIAKAHFAHGYHEMVQRVQDLAGGLVVTGPAWSDVDNPEIGGLINHYLVGAGQASGLERLRTMNLVRDLTAGEYAGYQEVLAVHAEGSFEAERMQILREAPIDDYLEYAQQLANVEAAVPVD